ncbi:histidinol dehydrogenase [Marivivens sp.]|uniref:histidinol dehydrogenase n=1 Tax=Marivivens sp. TaxID=1978374 RepID=UPI0025C25506|nr:histidinol dehydrogenase [Marivivens sp.]
MLAWESVSDQAVNQRVDEIIAAVRASGDTAVVELTNRFDRTQVSSFAELEMSKDRLQTALTRISSEQREALEVAANRVRSYHERQLSHSWQYEEADGTLLGQKVTPMDRVGIYVPGGKAAYPSSVLMNAMPAKVAGVMNCDIHLTDKLSIYFQEVKKGLGIDYIPPCVNRSLATFDVVDQKLVYALGALKNVGADAMRLVVEGRGEKPFATLFDFARRCDLKRIGKRPLEMLARAGAFDQLDSNRKRVFDSLEALVGYSAAIQDQKTSNQVSLFGEAGDDLPEPRLANTPDWLPAVRLAEEYKAIGFYLSGHPLDDYMTALKRNQVLSLDDVMAKAEHGACVVKMAGHVAGRQERKSARGNRFAFAQLSDPTGAYEVTIFSDTLDVCRDHLETGNKVVLTVEATMESDQLKLLARSIVPIDTVVSDLTSSALRVYVNEPQAVSAISTVLEGAKTQKLRGARGPVILTLMTSGDLAEIDIDLSEDFPINPEIKGALRSLDGVMDVVEA